MERRTVPGTAGKTVMVPHARFAGTRRSRCPGSGYAPLRAVADRRRGRPPKAPDPVFIGPVSPTMGSA